MKHIKGLDTLRAFAVILVIITHWGPHSFHKSAFLTFIITKVIPDGRFGVDLFFVLSGYLITRILLESRQKSLEINKLSIIKNFYIRRALRIFPIYFLFILFVGYVVNEHNVRDNIFYYLTYTSNILVFKEREWIGQAHTWSLSVEEQFYLIWPWIIIYTPQKNLLTTIISAIALGIASSLALNYFYGDYFFVLLLPCITAFGIGALYAYVEVYKRYTTEINKLFLILLPFCIILLFIHQLGGTPNVFFLIRLINAIIAINLIGYARKESRNVISRFIFQNRVLAQIGKVSYGIYLYHYVLPAYVLQSADYLKRRFGLNNHIYNVLTTPPSAYLIHLLLLLILAFFSYYYFERYFLKIKKRYNYVPQKNETVQSQY